MNRAQRRATARATKRQHRAAGIKGDCAIATADAERASGELSRLNYDPDRDPASLFYAHHDWAERYARRHYPAETRYPNPRDPDRPLKVGYVSGDFRRHPVAFFVEPILRSHDHSKVRPYCYSNAEQRDDLNEHFRNLVPLWRDISGHSDERVASIIRRDGIDILVDLSGHTARNRLLVFARKPAPIQLTAIGYVTTTGLATMDYRLTDAWCDPPDCGDGNHSECLWRLPGGFNCYTPPKGLPDPGPPPSLADGQMTFGSFNNLDKISHDVLALWGAIVAAVPGARLLLKTKTLGRPAARKAILDQLSGAGIAPERVDLMEWSHTLRSHFECYRRIDIALDPFPYNGTTTSCEALMMGVPVVALAGMSHASRVSASILARLGLEILTAPDAQGYLQRAITLAGRPETLRNLRSSLRQRLIASPLADAQRYTAELESAYRTMWRDWCASSYTGPTAVPAH